MKISCKTHGLQDVVVLSHGNHVCSKCQDEQVIGREVIVGERVLGKVKSVSASGRLEVCEDKEQLTQINS